MKAVEKRIEKLEANLPALPCRKPGHDGLSIFVKRDDENDAGDQILDTSENWCGDWWSVNLIL